MKNYTKYGVGIASLCLSLMLVNCGGGSSSSGGENSSSDGSTKGELTNKSVESFAASISEELGCTYTSEGNVQAAVNKNGFLAVGRAGAVVFSNTKRTGTTLQRATPRECSSPMAGGCGGSATICSSGESLIADFSDYCTQDYGGVSTTLDGKITIGIAQSDDGSATYTASTQSPLSIKTVNPNTEENVDVTLSLSNGKAVKAPTECGMHVTASSISVTDNIAKENYS
ncbi:MAG TPA: hypothetical protein ENL02_03970, partial [Epsilonproteobacteria bacterium]|nr:hypothetical protein [Campylobacterota bacterium]